MGRLVSIICMSAQYYRITRRLGTPHRNSVTVTIPLVGPQGPAGPQGPQGLPGEVSGSIAWDNVSDKPTTFPPSAHTHVAADITDFTAAVEAVSPPADWDTLANKPASFTPSAHGSTHHTGGTDAIAAHQINGQTIFAAGNVTYSADETVGVSRAIQLTVSNTNASGINLTLPTGLGGTLNGDTHVIIGGSTVAGPITIRRVNVLSPLIYETLATITAAEQQFRFRSAGGNTGNWSLVPVDTHTHPSTAITDFNTAAAAAAPVQSVNGNTGTVTVAVPSASTATPSALGVAAAGTASEFSRGDHVHALPSASDVGAVGATLLDAKGDLIVASANDTAARLAVGGTNGHVLTVDSGETLGVKWAAAGGDATTQTDIFTSNGTWTKPSGAKHVHYTVIGGGGGGGSGRIAATGTDRGGGGGGSGAGLTLGWINASALGATETITVGSGGAGGASNTASTDANGNAGSNGGNSSIGTVAIGFAGNGGQGGVGSGTANGGAGTGDRSIIYGTNLPLGAGGPSPATSAATTTPRVFAAPTGGGGAGRITSGNAAGGGAAGGPMGSATLGEVPATAGTAAGAGAGLSGTTAYNFAGTGGAGASSASVGAKGGDGGNYGGGGGGGSAAANGAGGDNSGGKGGDGIVVITTYF
jgi:hypothetical protein